MAVRGRPTPQPRREGEDGRPRYRDRRPEELRRGDVNPYTTSHRDFGPVLLPADEAWRRRGAWDAEFGRPGPLHVEIGSGNGFFLTELARRHPDWNLVGLEIRYKRTVLLARKLAAAGVTNARSVRYHAAFLDDLFEPGSLDGLYVNHPDPWPKERHEKNRLISRWFLEDVVSLLRPGGWLRLKSDHRPNVDRVLELLDRGPEGEPLPRLPLEVIGRSEDVTTGPAPWPDDIETNYQRKFRLRGLPVYAVEVRRTSV
ncbi:MAG: tRNA (guanosine(46)-N7)-methyltransferase TrmB [Alphaproteobacteria bacterium]|nr:tRNA (guanosine(46)-N7)-methyltransferase TrmB [Alphaproteobacteria bacterium]